ncbi:hypothetical protein CDAR_370291 [Caerostris darwini]|uniref:Uncharacterized protein n=1 Tax=Caerostris darwini TaxID=1538125 RepID=A0AAV4NLU4_9ARAC|nr:hypothetical protein CDAR_370291 [Caerostris darwini]
MDASLLGKDHSWGHAPGFSIYTEWIYLGKFRRLPSLLVNILWAPNPAQLPPGTRPTWTRVLWAKTSDVATLQDFLFIPSGSIWGSSLAFHLLWSIFHGPRNSWHLGLRLIFIALVWTRVLSCLQTPKDDKKPKET